MKARFPLALVGVLLSGAALAQSVPLQGGPWTPGHTLMYAPSNGGTQPMLLDAGPAVGGGPSAGLGELLLQARGLGTAPYANAGTGPLGTNHCEYDGPATGTAHYLCFSANAQGGGLIAYGTVHGASPLPLFISVNGSLGTFGNMQGSGASIAGHVATYLGTTGTVVQDGGYVAANKAGDTFTGSVNVAAGLSYQINGTNVLGPASLAAAMMPALTGDVTSSAGTVATSIAAGAVSAAKMASGAAVGNIGYTPANKAGDTFGGAVTIPTLTVSGCTGYLYGNAASAATCSTSIPFTQVGTGAVARTVDAKLKNSVFSVLDYGAACDGATNDTVAIRAAINAVQAAGGGILEFPYKGGLCQVNTSSLGQFILSGDVAVTLRGIGDGGVKNNATDGSNTFYIGGAGPGTHQALVQLQNLKVWGSTSNGSGVYVSFATNTQIIGSSFYQNGQMGVFGDSSYSIVIDHNTMSANGVAGIYVQNAGGNAARITHNVISGHTGVNHAGIAFGGTTNYNIQIMNNSIELNYWGIHGDNVQGLTIIGNYMENNAGSNTEINLTSATVKGVTVVGNTFFGYVGINSADGVVVTGNTFTGTGPALDGTSSTNTFVAGNIFTNAGTVANVARTGLSAKTAVASLPTCNAGAEGSLYSVTDANSTTFNAAVAGGGANHVMAYCNGTGWTVH